MRRMAVAGFLVAVVVGVTVLLSGCPSNQTNNNSGSAPKFTLAWSEYPSWSVFGVAADRKLIDGAAGKMGELEKKWNVDIVLQGLDYDPCIQAYASNQCDAVCITNMDALNPALGRKSVAIIPTSTSVGADACIVDVDKIKDVDELKKFTTFGLEKSVSQYVFIRGLEELGKKPEEYQFSNMDPAAAATALQTPKENKKEHSIMVWNPYTLETLNKNPKAKVLFDSSKIPEEVIDMVVIGQDVLDKPGGDRFAQCVIETYYEFNKLLDNPGQRNDLLYALGEKFSHLGVEDMKKATTQTRFYKTPDAALGLYDSDAFKKRMEKIVEFCVKNQIVPKAPTVTFSATKDNSDLRFDSSFIKKVAGK